MWTNTQPRLFAHEEFAHYYLETERKEVTEDRQEGVAAQYDVPDDESSESSGVDDMPALETDESEETFESESGNHMDRRLI